MTRGHWAYGEDGFTLVEILVTILILGLLLTIGALSYANIRKGVNITGAKKQVEEAMNRAKTAARQENVNYWLVFYPGDATNPGSYEFYRNEYRDDPDNPGTMSWLKTPVNKSVAGESVTEVSGHWYISIPNGVQMTGVETTVVFDPAGTVMTVTPATISLQAVDVTGSVSIDDKGTITVH